MVFESDRKKKKKGRQVVCKTFLDEKNVCSPGVEWIWERDRERMADLVDLTAGFKCPFGGSTININVSLRPGYDTTRQGFGAASSQVVDLPRGELSVPDVEVGQFSHKCLGGIKSTTKCILEWKKNK